MGTSVSELEKKFNLKVNQTFRWGTAFHDNSHGIYIITTNSQSTFLPSTNHHISFCECQIQSWMQNAPEITLDGRIPSAEELKKRLSEFWLPDESVLYIGKAERQKFSERICQYYNHKVGKKSPHKGGYWLKLLLNLRDFHIHLLPTNNSHEIEVDMLQYFMDNVSNETKDNLFDKRLCLPFANLQLKSGVIKNHGLKKQYQ